ncbi:MAG: hypothetical protein KDJ30_16525, partial [Rhodoblastus sp.]|nr:hypothetical protein [Rhodoblastus sp.]
DRQLFRARAFDGCDQKSQVLGVEILLERRLQPFPHEGQAHEGEAFLLRPGEFSVGGEMKVLFDLAGGLAEFAAGQVNAGRRRLIRGVARKARLRGDQRAGDHKDCPSNSLLHIHYDLRSDSRATCVAG